jgi:adenylate cyclase
VIGRSTGAAIQIPDNEISGQHCKLELVNGRVLLSDIGSNFGTAVNGVPIKVRQRIESGDSIALGKIEFRFRIHP